jgi:threonine/homoserine/homoserine lactone efflux protein
MIDRPDLLLPITTFAVASAFTPGPNNVMLMTSGLNFGMRRSIPVMCGVIFGFAFLVLCTGLGLGAVFSAFPLAYNILKIIGDAYLLYLAWIIATSAPPNPSETTNKNPIGFFKAAALQWINVKGWVMAVASVSTYAAIATYPLNGFVIARLFCLVCIGSSLTWTGFGLLLQKFLHRPKLVRTFNIFMALLLVLSLYPTLVDFWK